MVQLVKNPPVIQENWVWSLGWEDLLEKVKATNSSILAWRIQAGLYSPWGRKQPDMIERLKKKKSYKVDVYVFHVKTFHIFFADKVKHEVPILELF